MDGLRPMNVVAAASERLSARGGGDSGRAFSVLRSSFCRRHRELLVLNSIGWYCNAKGNRGIGHLCAMQAAMTRHLEEDGSNLKEVGMSGRLYGGRAGWGILVVFAIGAGRTMSTATITEYAERGSKGLDQIYSARGIVPIAGTSAFPHFTCRCLYKLVRAQKADKPTSSQAMSKKRQVRKIIFFFKASGVEHVTPTDSRSTPGAFGAGAGCGYVKNSCTIEGDLDSGDDYGDSRFSRPKDDLKGWARVRVNPAGFRVGSGRVRVRVPVIVDPKTLGYTAGSWTWLLALNGTPKLSSTT
ncbi:hypothetical protein B0H11DRAFT_1903731 [Mycena galericulata]|nr:hypothetical protein B0H11DRAFT_1903731 [Mycena galericulata]